MNELDNHDVDRANAESRQEWIDDIADDICSLWLPEFAEWILSTDNPEREFELFRECFCIYKQLPEAVTIALDYAHCYGSDTHPYKLIQACIMDYQILPDGITSILDKYASEAAQEVAEKSDKDQEESNLGEIVNKYKSEGIIK